MDASLEKSIVRGYHFQPNVTYVTLGYWHGKSVVCRLSVVVCRL